MKITKEEYAELIIIKEKVELIKKVFIDTGYFPSSLTKIILDIEDETEEKGE